MNEQTRPYADPKVVEKISRLQLKARHIVEGFVTGMHRSPYHGFSIEFAKHRHYSPGDDIRHLDWKVFGRNDRLYIKEYELETNLRSHILLDTSESMDYAAEGKTSKLEFACFVAASMATLILRQQDSVSMVTFNKEPDQRVPSSSSMGHLGAILGTLARSKPEGTTDLGTILHQTADQIQRRGLIIIISDLLDDPDRILKGLQHLRHRRHDVILFHILDGDEIDFPFSRMTQFEGMEEEDLRLLIEPRSLQQAYQEEVENFCHEIRQGCTRYRIDYALLRTDRALDVELSKYLARRLASTWRT